MNANYATNIVYSIGRSDVEDRVEFLKNEYPEEITFLLGKRFNNLDRFSTEEIADIIERKLKRNSLKTPNFLGLDSFMKLPSDIKKDDYESITEYLSDATGYMVTSYAVETIWKEWFLWKIGL